MKQRYSIFTLMLFFVVAGTTAFAQQRTLSGTITDPEGKGIPGVNVIVKGTSAGTASDADGKYSLSVNQSATTLVFSFIGYVTQEVPIGTQSTINITLAQDVTELSEVVVTALGVERDKRALQYSLTEVNGDNLTQARENNLAAALSGRVAGVNVSKVASGPAGSTRIVIRGNKTVGGQNQPLYVIDGMPMTSSMGSGSGFGQAGLWGGRDEGDGLTSINPDDIESISVLKGANASALYGSRGGNGVILITTKKGGARKGIGIEFNSNLVFESVMNLTDLQTKYGHGNYTGGIAIKPTLDNTSDLTRFNSYDFAFRAADDSWGTVMDGSPALYPDGKVRPYTYAGDNWERFYETGQAWTNSLSLTGGGDKQTFRFSASDLRHKGVVPNSGFDRTNVTLSVNSKFLEKLTLDAKVMYSHEYAKNRPVLSDSPNNANQTVWRMPPSMNVEDYVGDPNKPGAIPLGMDSILLVAYGQGGPNPIIAKRPGQEFLIAANNWGQNPYWATQQMINDDWRDRIITQGSLRYDFTDFLYLQGRVSMDWFTRKTDDLVPEGTGHAIPGSRRNGEARRREINMDLTLGFNKTFGDFSVNAFVGGNRMRTENEYYELNGNGFSVPFVPSILNTVTRTWAYNYSGFGINSWFGSAEFGYKGILFLTGTYRTDYWSVLYSQSGLSENFLGYPSVGASFVFSDMFTGLPAWLSFGKVRASWAQSGFIGDLGPYGMDLTYSLSGNSHPGFDGVPRTMATFTQAQNQSGTIPNPGLKPATSDEIEFGLDIRLFNNRVGVDVTYYSQTTTDDILSAAISRASGFGTTRVNVGELSNKGIEILLTGTPVQGPLTWDVSLNFAKNTNEVVFLSEGVKELVPPDFESEPRTRNVRIKHLVGYPFGMITGRVQQTSPDGVPIFNDNGTPLASTEYVPIGNGIADWTGGFNNSFSWKGFNLSFLIDFKIGGDLFSGTNNRLTQWGLHKQSLIGREGEAPLTIEGVTRTQTGVDEEGDPVYSYSPVSRTLTPQEARTYWSNVGGEATAISTMFMYDASFGKLRQLTFGYNLPRALLSKTPFQSVSLSFVGRNLAILWKNIENVDPESAYSNDSRSQGLEYFAMPPVRSYGFNLRLGF